MIPEELTHRFPDDRWRGVEGGCSGALLFRATSDAEHLKVARRDTWGGDYLAREISKLRWLERRIPVPEVLETGSVGEWIFLRDTSLRGVVACDPSLVARRPEKVRLLAKGLRTIHALPIGECPFDERIAVQINRLRSALDKPLGTIFKMDTSDQKAAAKRSFEKVMSMSRPEEQPVFTHGDYCEPNVFIDGEHISGFVDLGDAGIADRYQDLAQMVRSLRRNGDGELVQLFFDEYGLKPVDEIKVGYYHALADVLP